MSLYVARRLLLFVPTLIGVSLAIFIIMRVIPGDPATVILGGSDAGTSGYNKQDLQHVREQLGLNKPIPVQYALWVGGALKLDFGTSIRYSSPVGTEILHPFPLTLELTALSLILGLAIGLPIGMLSATRQNTRLDYSGRVLSSLGLAIPNFWLGTLVIVALARWFDWVPPLGYATITENPQEHLQQIVPPVLVLGYGFAAFVARLSRAQVLEVLREDYVRTAFSKGLRSRTV